MWRVCCSIVYRKPLPAGMQTPYSRCLPFLVSTPSLCYISHDMSIKSNASTHYITIITILSHQRSVNPSARYHMKLTYIPSIIVHVSLARWLYGNYGRLSLHSRHAQYPMIITSPGLDSHIHTFIFPPVSCLLSIAVKVELH